MKREYVNPKAESIELVHETMIAASATTRSSSNGSPAALHESSGNDWDNIWK
ncbi:MAG: hypothetical protein IKZ37_04515 [Bacteroidaceae bacterium]|nr:hypothetical protein [Bacteroidaceae bacterium]